MVAYGLAWLLGVWGGMKSLATHTQGKRVGEGKVLGKHQTRLTMCNSHNKQRGAIEDQQLL